MRVGNSKGDRGCISWPSSARLQPPLVADRLLLHIFDIERPAETVVLIEDTRRPFTAQHAAQQRGQFHGVVNPEVETQPAERIVHVGTIAREKDAALAE